VDRVEHVVCVIQPRPHFVTQRNLVVIYSYVSGFSGHISEYSPSAPSCTMLLYMADTKTGDDERCVACDWAFNGLMFAGVLAVAFLAWDTFSGGGATEWASRLIDRMRPTLASVTPIRQDDSDAG